jgi:methionyl-tRNA synthetase
VFSHGFVNGPDGRKMSKTYGNTEDPVDLLKLYSVDSMRYYMCGSITFGADINFSKEGMITMHNSELADILGNLVHRVLTLAQKFCGGMIPDLPHDAQFCKPFDLKALKEGVEQDLKDNAINAAVFRAMDAARATNR